MDHVVRQLIPLVWQAVVLGVIYNLTVAIINFPIERVSRLIAVAIVYFSVERVPLLLAIAFVHFPVEHDPSKAARCAWKTVTFLLIDGIYTKCNLELTALSFTIGVNIDCSIVLLDDLLDYHEAEANSLIVHLCSTFELPKSWEDCWDVLFCNSNARILHYQRQLIFTGCIDDWNKNLAHLCKLYRIFHKIH